MSNLTDLDSLDVTVNIIDPSDQYLGLVLIAPSGHTFTLAERSAGTPARAAANLGVQTYTNNNIGDYALGTTFDDNATRDIFDRHQSQGSAPYIGDYQPERGVARRSFLAERGSRGHQRHLDAGDPRHRHQHLDQPGLTSSTGR